MAACATSTIHRKILQIYILLIPFVNAFSPSGKFPLPLIFLCVSVAVLCFRLRKGYASGGAALFALNDDYLLFGTFFLAIMLVTFSFNCVNEKTFNHIFAVLTVLTFFYFFVRYLISRLTDLSLIFRYSAYALFLVGAYIICEFMFNQIFGIKLDDYIYRPTVEVLDASIFDGLFSRPRGFAEEPGLMALFFEVFLPLSIVHMRRYCKMIIIPYYAVAVTGFLLLFSAASIGSFFTVAFLFLLVRVVRGMRIRLNFKTFLAGAVLLLLLIQWHEEVYFYIHEVAVVKFMGLLDLSDSVGASSTDRSEKYAQFFNLFSEYPFGVGWGIVASTTGDYKGIDIPVGFISLYAEIFAAAGIFGGASFLLFLAAKIRRALSLRGTTGKILLFALLWTCLHYSFVSCYWMPWLWFLLALLDVSVLLQKEGAARKPVPGLTGIASLESLHVRQPESCATAH